MVRDGQIGLNDIRRVWRKYWWIVPVSTIGLAVLGGIVAKVLPKRYTSETRVLVSKPIVSAKAVEPVMTDDLNHRLASMQEQILSRSRLEPVIQKLDLYASDRNKVHMEDLVARLRSAIVITPMEPIRGADDRSLPGFTVSVNFNDPTMAQRICTEITSMFMKQNGEARNNQARMATSFFASEVEGAKRDLDEQDAKLAEFKKKYIGALPEESQTNLSLLGGMNAQLEATTQALSRAQQDKAFNETLLSQAEVNWKSQLSGGQNPDTLEQQLQVLQDQLTTLQARYTSEHPDVIKTKNQIAEIKKRIAAAKTAAPVDSSEQGPGTTPANIQQLRAKVHQDEISIADLSKRQAQVQAQTRVLEARLQMSPVVEQELKDLTRSYQAALDFYNDVQKKHNNSEMAKDLESQQQSEQFRVLDEPNLPLSPSFPKMAIFAGVGAGAGLALALAVLYLIAAGDKTFHNERDVELSLKLPVLAMIPSVAKTSNHYAKQSSPESFRFAGSRT